MSRLSINSKGFKRFHQTRLDEANYIAHKKLQKEKIIQEKRREEEEIKQITEKFKSSWRSELFPEEIEETLVEKPTEVLSKKEIKLAEKWKYDWRKSFDEKPEKELVEKELVEKVFEPITFIKNIKISDSIFDNFSNISNWRDELIDEGMSSKDFPDLYGYGISIFDMPITSTIQTPVQSTQAQDIVDASADATDHEFGPQFPGSYRNVVGGVQSLSKVDVQAHITTDHEVTPNQGEMAHPEKHVFTYQSEGNSIKWPTEFTLPDSFNDDLMWFDAQGNPQEWIHYIWPVHGHPGNYTPLDSDDDDTLFWYDPHPHDTPGSSWGFNSETDSDAKFRLRMTYNDGRIDRRSITDTSFDVTYGAARSIDSTAFDLTGNMDSTPWSEGFEDDYSLDVNDTAALNALRLQWDKPRTEPGHEDWQYIRSGTQTGYIDQIYGVDFPFAEYDYSPYESDHWQFTGTDGWDRIHPNLNTDASFAKKIIKNVQVGDKISFSYKWYSDTWLYNTENYGDSSITDYYVHDGVRYGDHDWNSSYFRAVIGANNKVVSIKDQYQMIGADPSLTLTDGTYTIPPLPNPDNPEDNELYNEYNITKKDNGFSFPYSGTYEYTVQEGDIDAAGLFQFTTILLAESTNLEYVQVTNFAHTVGDQTRTAAGQLGKTTDAYNLGTSVASLNPNNKKKKEEEEKKRLAEIERIAEMKRREEAQAKVAAAAEAAEEKRVQVLIDKAKEQSYTYKQSKSDTGLDTWKGELEGLSGVKIADRTLDQNNPTSIPNGFFGGAEFITSLEQYDSQPPDGIPLFIGPVDGLNYDKLLEGFTTPQIKADGSRGFVRNKLTPWHTYIASRETRYMRENPEFGRPKLEAMLRHPVYRADFLARTSPEFRKWINSVPNVKTGNSWLGKYSRPNLFPPGRAGFVGQFGGWWLPGDDSHEEVVEAVKRAYTLFGSYNGQWGLALVEDPADDGTPVNDDPYAIEDPIFKDDEDVDPEMRDLLEILERLKKDPLSLTDKEIGILKKYGYEDEVSEMNDLRKLVEDSGVDWSSILKALYDAGNVALDVAAIVGLLFPEPGSSAAGLARLIPKLKKLRALMKSAKSWWNRGRNKRIPNENEAPFGKIGDAVAKDPDKTDSRSLFGDDRRQRGQSDDAFDAGEKSSLIGRPDRAVLGVDLDPRSPNFGRRVKADRGGPGSSPTPLIRQTFERPVRSVRDNPKGGIAARSTRTVDESFVPKNNKNISGDINNTIDIFIKLLSMTRLSNNQVDGIIQKFEEYSRNNNINKNTYRDFGGDITREKNSNPLYPGQPSPNGFPDTPPPKLAPNGYHPQFGRKADRYRRLDSISAKTMDRVKTGDPETDAQVSAAAKSVFKRFKKYR